MRDKSINFILEKVDNEQFATEQIGSEIPESLPSVGPSRTSSRKIIAFITILFAVLLTSGAIYLWKNKPSGETSLIEKSTNWISYQNEEYGFRMEYPANWEIDIKEKGGVREGLVLKIDWKVENAVQFGLEVDPRPLNLVLSHLAPEKEKIIGKHKYYYTKLQPSSNEDNRYSRWLYITGGSEKTTPVFEIAVPREKEKSLLEEFESVLARLEFIEKKLPPTLTLAPAPALFLPAEAKKIGWKKSIGITYSTPDDLEFTFHEIEVIDVVLPVSKEEKALLEKESSRAGSAKTAFDISIKNNSQKKIYINPYDFQLKDELDRELKGYFVLGAKEPGLKGELLPGETARGYLTFEVPFTTKKTILYRKRIIELSPTPGSMLPATKEEYDMFLLEATST